MSTSLPTVVLSEHWRALPRPRRISFTFALGIHLPHGTFRCSVLTIRVQDSFELGSVTNTQTNAVLGRTCQECIADNQAREINRLQDTATPRLSSPAFPVKENPLSDRFYHRDLQGSPVCRIFCSRGLRLSRMSELATDAEMGDKWTNKGSVIEWRGGTTVLVDSIP